MNLIEIGKPFVTEENRSKERDEWLEDQQHQQLQMQVNSPQASWRSPRSGGGSAAGAQDQNLNLLKRPSKDKSDNSDAAKVGKPSPAVSVRNLKHDTVEAVEMKKTLAAFHEQRKSDSGSSPTPIAVLQVLNSPQASNRQELEQLEDEYEENSPRAQRRAKLFLEEEKKEEEDGVEIDDDKEENGDADEQEDAVDKDKRENREEAEEQKRRKILEQKRLVRERRRLDELKAEEEEEMKFQDELKNKRKEREKRKQQILQQEQLEQQVSGQRETLKW